jgi:hypothetical protein
VTSAALRIIRTARPGRVPFDAMQRFEAVADCAADPVESAVETGMKLGSSGLVRAVKDLVDHGQYPLRRWRGNQRAIG